MTKQEFDKLLSFQEQGYLILMGNELMPVKVEYNKDGKMEVFLCSDEQVDATGVSYDDFKVYVELPKVRKLLDDRSLSHFESEQRLKERTRKFFQWLSEHFYPWNSDGAWIHNETQKAYDYDQLKEMFENNKTGV